MKNIKPVKVLSVILVLGLVTLFSVGCMRESGKASYNIEKEADNFNVTRKITVMNTITDTVLFQMEGTFSLKNNDENELVVICETGENEYKQHYIYLNKFTTYVIEDVSGSDVDPYHYELNFLPEWGFKITHSK